MNKVSIIIPIYNVEEYLEECLNTVIKISNLNIQVICIDDCSTDNSFRILNEFRMKHGNSNIEIYRNSINRGLSYTRNIGLKYADGKYVLFVDSDDFVKTDAIKKLVHEIEMYDLDVLYFDVEEFTDLEDRRIVSDKRKRTHHYEISSGLKLFDAMVNNGEMFGCVWDGIYKREFLERLGAHFIEGILHEDIPFTFSLLLHAERALAVSTTGYSYRQRSGSILHQQNYLGKLHGLLVGYMHMIIEWHDVENEINTVKYADSINTYLNTIISMIESTKNKLENIPKDDILTKHFFDNYQIKARRKFDQIFNENMLLNLRQYRKIAIYGAGKVATEMIPFLVEKRIPISTIFVTESVDNKTELFGIPVCEYNMALGQKFEAIIVAVSRSVQKEIVDVLLKKGYCGKIISMYTK